MTSVEMKAQIYDMMAQLSMLQQEITKRQQELARVIQSEQQPKQE